MGSSPVHGYLPSCRFSLQPLDGPPHSTARGLVERMLCSGRNENIQASRSAGTGLGTTDLRSVLTKVKHCKIMMKYFGLEFDGRFYKEVLWLHGQMKEWAGDEEVERCPKAQGRDWLSGTQVRKIMSCLDYAYFCSGKKFIIIENWGIPSFSAVEVVRGILNIWTQTPARFFPLSSETAIKNVLHYLSCTTLISCFMYFSPPWRLPE